jgi:hypothetical protein
VANKKKKVGTTFEELNEQVKNEQATGGLAGLEEIMAKAFQDPEMMKAFEQMNAGLQAAMEEMGKMEPEKIQKQMEEAMKAMTSGDIVEAVIEKKDEVLANLKKTGLVSEEELKKYEADPRYFEDQMRTAFDQMKGLFNPETLKTATEAMMGMQEAFNDPVVKELQELLLADTVTDLQIEELRLKIIQKPELLSGDNPALAMFAGIADDVKNTAKWKKGFMEGRDALKAMKGAAGKMGTGAGVGEF